MAWSEIKVCNIALARIGIMRSLSSTDGTVAGITDQNDEQRAAQLLYEAVRDSLLEGFPWARATKYVTLALLSDGDGHPWEDVWDNAYSYPADALVIRGFVVPQSTQNALVGEPQYPLMRTYPAKWAIGTHGGDPAIFANVQESDATVEYISKNTQSDELGHNFNMAMAWQLSAEFALALQADDGKAQNAQRMAMLWSSVAFRVSGNEHSGGPQPDGEFVSVRGV